MGPEMGDAFKESPTIFLTVGSTWKSLYELYAHSAAAAKAGLTSEQINALVTGRACEGLSDDEVAAQRFTHQLASKHAVDDETYDMAHEAFGDRGLMDTVT